MVFDNDFLTTLDGKKFAQFGDFSVWPAYYARHDTPETIMKRFGAVQVEKVTKEIDYLIVGGKRKKGRADAIRKAKKFGITILDQATFFYQTRPNIDSASFAFIGGFDFLPDNVVNEQSYSVLAEIGCTQNPSVTADTDYLVLGEKRGKGKAAQQKLADKHNVEIMTEHQFLDLVAHQISMDNLSFQALVIKLYCTTDTNRLKKALQMLKEDSFSLYNDYDNEHISGIVSSQTGTSSAYSCMLNHEGGHACCSDDLDRCWGLQGGGACKHILVLVLGLVQSGDVDANTALQWVQSSMSQKDKEDAVSKDLMAKTWLRYKGAKAGEVDWRPMETVPEDYYAF